MRRSSERYSCPQQRQDIMPKSDSPQQGALPVGPLMGQKDFARPIAHISHQIAAAVRSWMLENAPRAENTRATHVLRACYARATHVLRHVLRSGFMLHSQCKCPSDVFVSIKVSFQINIERKPSPKRNSLRIRCWDVFVLEIPRKART